MNIKRQTLADQLQALLEEYQVVSAQLARTLSDVERVRLQRHLRDLEQRITEIEAELAALGNSPLNDDIPGSADPPPAPVLDHPSRPPRKAPIWIWYVVVVLFGFVLGVATDLAALLGLLQCEALWVVAALALISGVAILGFSWLPDQRSLHMKKDRVILVGLTLMVTIGLAASASASASCSTTPPPSIEVALRTSHDRYVTAQDDKEDHDWRLWGSAVRVDNWERFELRCVEGGEATLFTYHLRYVTAMDETAGWVLRGPRLESDSVDASELFTLLNPRTGKPISCSRVVRQIEQNESVSLAIQTAHDRYVTAQNGKEDGDWRIWADKPGPIRADEQIFTVIKQPATQD